MINIIFEDNIDFYFARERVLERLTLASTFLPPGVVPYLAPDATALGQIFWYTVEGDGHDLGRLRAIQDWYVRYQLNSRPRRGPGGLGRRLPHRVPDRRRPQQAPRLRRDPGRAVTPPSARSNSSVGGRVIQKGNAEYIVRGVGWITDAQRHREHRRQGRSQAARRSTFAISPRCSWARVPPQRAGKERQRGGRRRGDDALRREPAGGHQADQGQDRGASGRACPRACGSCRSTTAPG